MKEIFELFNYRCVICYKPAVAIHEIEYRSKHHKNPLRIDNRVPLCAECHEMVHREGAKKWSKILVEKRLIALLRWGK